MSSPPPASDGRRRRAPRLLAAGALVCLPLALAAAEPADDARAAAGARRLASEPCQECHGETGNSLSRSTPKLAAQAAAYLVKQLHDFQTGAREHPVMSTMAASLTGEDRRDIAAYFSTRAREPEAQPLSSARGRDLFRDGDVDRGIPQCASCHGEAGQGASARGVTAPMLARQHRTYLRIQLLRWRLGERRNSPEGVMNRVASLLTDDDIDALAEHLSGL